ncbi:hypothetical protein PYW08_004307 [Mythimna loreyi]|uniref:Uncharacterized protein n=1 Tax=Mythimna loreyi TaxID=667449 RepID=A0ACC2QNH8_9NEOP|nr:hypothetical protein PYW08_004307 [Mythimna loreyi]
MCVKNVFVLMLLLCVNFRAQLGATSSPVHQNISGDTDIIPQFKPAPVLTDNTNITELESYAPHNPQERAGVPRNLAVTPLDLKDSYPPQLQFNVSWLPSLGRAAESYTVEVLSEKNTTYCNLKVCLIHDIPGNATWVLIPEALSIMADADCVFRPNCSYTVKLNSNPWDGKNITKRLDLDDCVVGVCSCEHADFLPVPNVTTSVFTKEGVMYSNITWFLPKPTDPKLLPPAKLRKLSYIVSLIKPFLPNKINSTRYIVIENRAFDFNGSVSEGDITRSARLQLTKRNPLSDDVPEPPTTKIWATVKLQDERKCLGRNGLATAFEPGTPTNAFGISVVLGALLGLWAMGTVVMLSKSIVKRVLKSLRPAPVSAPLEPLRRRPAWFPLQLRT